MIIGLTGTYCAGKNYAARLLEARGLPALDVDKLGHRAIELERDLILARFGREVLGPDGAVDRRSLGQRVFAQPGELAALEAIVHPRANRLIDEWIAGQRSQGRSCVINAALLHRSPAFTVLDALIIVQAPLPVRLIRARRRDKLPWGEIFKRVWSQRNFTVQYLRKNADTYRVYNGGYSGRCLERQLGAILSRLGL